MGGKSCEIRDDKSMKIASTIFFSSTPSSKCRLEFHQHAAVFALGNFLLFPSFVVMMIKSQEDEQKCNNFEASR